MNGCWPLTVVGSWTTYLKGLTPISVQASQCLAIWPESTYLRHQYHGKIAIHNTHTHSLPCGPPTGHTVVCIVLWAIQHQTVRCGAIIIQIWQWMEYKTRTTRTSALWGYPPTPQYYPYYWFILDPKSKQDVKFTNLKNLPKTSIVWILNKSATHLLKLLDKICKYEMDPTSIVEYTERTRFRPQTDRRTNWQSETSISPFNFVEAGV